MLNSEIASKKVPQIGPLTVGWTYRRRELNDRFGGNRMSGIVVSPREPVILLFHTKEPAQQFYQDGFDDDGIYWYSGEGTRGDMNWTHANEAVRNHSTDGKDIFLFERVQRKGGIWQLARTMRYFEHRIEQRPDKDGLLRKAIIFGLIEAGNNEEDFRELGTKVKSPARLADIRIKISKQEAIQPDAIVDRIKLVYRRSALVSQYAHARAKGRCESCMQEAPFLRPTGEPFLEVHHIDRLADGGADHVDKVAAICPNCHRRCHYSADQVTFNLQLAARIAALEASTQIDD